MYKAVVSDLKVKHELDENQSGGEDFMPDFDEVKAKKPDENEEF